MRCQCRIHSFLPRSLVGLGISMFKAIVAVLAFVAASTAEQVVEDCGKSNVRLSHIIKLSVPF